MNLNERRGQYADRAECIAATNALSKLCSNQQLTADEITLLARTRLAASWGYTLPTLNRSAAVEEIGID